MRRYVAAVDGDRGLADAWHAVRALAKKQGDRDRYADALAGLAALEPEPAKRGALLRQLGIVQRDERVDVAAAEQAFTAAVLADPSDAESLDALLALLAARLAGEQDLSLAKARPTPAMLDAARGALKTVVDDAAARGGAAPFDVRRLYAGALAQGGDRQVAADLFEELLAEQPHDLPTLTAYAAHLAAQAIRAHEPRRLQLLESVLQHHFPGLDETTQVDVWGETAALRLATGDSVGARKAARKAMTLATSDELRVALSDRAVRACVAAFEDAPADDADPRLLVAALRLEADRLEDPRDRARLLERAAQAAQHQLGDRSLARRLLSQAVEILPTSVTARESLLQLDAGEGDSAQGVASTRALLRTETDPAKKAGHHLRLAELLRKTGAPVDEITTHFKGAVDLEPRSTDALAAAETYYAEVKDPKGLDAVLTTLLKALPREDAAARGLVLERLAQLRRYESGDKEGAIEALEAMAALDPDATKPREDAARLYTDLGKWREAAAAWRNVVERDPVMVEAWRGLFGLYAKTRQVDEAFAIASTMVAVEVADDDLARAVRAAKPPFPRWPLPPKDAAAVRRKLAHPLERTPIRLVLDIVGKKLHPRAAKPLSAFGLHRRDALPERALPSSILLAVRAAATLLGTELPTLYPATGPTDLSFAVLPADEPGIVVAEDALKGGMTPERAFALGRAIAWLSPHALLAATADARALKDVLEALVSRFLSPGESQLTRDDAEAYVREVERALLAGLTNDDESKLKESLVPALRDYSHARAHLHLGDFVAGVGYGGDRTGFILSGELSASVRGIKLAAGRQAALGARLAIKELVLFSASSGYLSLRRDLGLALPDDAGASLLDLA